MLRNLSENWHFKLMSLAAALVLWFFIMGERNLEVGYSVPLALKNVPPGMMVTNEVPSQVEIRLSGPRTLLVGLDAKSIAITVDLADLKPGLTSFKRLEERLTLPAGITVTRLTPAFLDVRLERQVEKTVPVRPHLSGRPAQGFKVEAIELLPERVRLQGAEGELRGIAEVQSERIDVEGVNKSLKTTVPIAYRGEFSRIVDQRQVEVAVRVVPSGETRKRKP